ncbi:MAG TPA: siderophore-interacting protein [Pseudonocardia sp.]|nr:siderophore-interacting protein [Pseudonocardia sp.]
MELSELRVVGTDRITPMMMRVRLGGESLARFRSVSPDQQAKFFFPKPGTGSVSVPPLPEQGDGQQRVAGWYRAFMAMPERERPWMRSFSIRRFHPERGEIDVDFVLHGNDPALVDAEVDEGPAASWARAARPGDLVGMLGPAVSHHLPVPAHDWRLLAGDESALPAIAALLEDDPSMPTVALIEVAGAADEQPLARARWAGDGLRWLHRDGVLAGRSSVLVDAIRAVRFPDGEPFVWVAGEASVVRGVRRHLVRERRLDRRRVAFCGYWRQHLTQETSRPRRTSPSGRR